MIRQKQSLNKILKNLKKVVFTTYISLNIHYTLQCNQTKHKNLLTAVS